MRCDRTEWLVDLRKGIAASCDRAAEQSTRDELRCHGALLIGHRQPERSPRDRVSAPGLAETLARILPAVEGGQPRANRRGVSSGPAACMYLLPFLMGVRP